MTTYIFFISFFFILSLAGLKSIDLKIRKIESLRLLFERSDRKINEFIEYFIYKYNWLRKVGSIFFFEFLPSLVYEGLVKMKDEVSRKYYQNADKFRGKRVLRSDGSVSFFLDRLSEENSPIERRKV